jgi:hypothetical protein
MQNKMKKTKNSPNRVKLTDIGIPFHAWLNYTPLNLSTKKPLSKPLKGFYINRYLLNRITLR